MIVKERETPHRLLVMRSLANRIYHGMTAISTVIGKKAMKEKAPLFH